MFHPVVCVDGGHASYQKLLSASFQWFSPATSSHPSSPSPRRPSPPSVMRLRASRSAYLELPFVKHIHQFSIVVSFV